MLAAGILPYLADKFTRLDNPSWVATARTYVEKAFAADVTLSTLLSGLASETANASELIRANVPEGERLAAYRTLTQIEALEIDVFVHHAVGRCIEWISQREGGTHDRLCIVSRL